jgi:hypothetical protein
MSRFQLQNGLLTLCVYMWFPMWTLGQNVCIMGNLRDTDRRDIDTIVSVAIRELGWEKIVVQIKNEPILRILSTNPIQELDLQLRNHLDDPIMVCGKTDITRKKQEMRKPPRRLIIYQTAAGKDAGLTFYHLSKLKERIEGLNPRLAKYDILIALNRPLNPPSVTILSPDSGLVVSKCKRSTEYYFKIRLGVHGENVEQKDLQLEFLDGTMNRLKLLQTDKNGNEQSITVEPMDVTSLPERETMLTQEGYDLCIFVPVKALFGKSCEPENQRNSSGNLVSYHPYYLKVFYKGTFQVIPPTLRVIYFTSLSEEAEYDECRCESR